MDISIFHVHTYRCRHASEETELEYVQKAIELDATEIIFTDHAPFPENPFNFRMDMNEFDEYVSVLNELKERYKNRIRIKVGLEIEYIPTYLDYYKWLKDRLDILLLGQHFSLLSNGICTFDMEDKSKEYKSLADGMIEGMKTGLFQAASHPDQIFRRMKQWNEEMEKIAMDIKECAVQNNVTLEQNISNMQGKKRHAYWKEFWKNMPYGLKTVYGVDAHSVEEMETNVKKQWELMGSKE